MSIRTTTKNVVQAWAGVPPISNTLVELCVLWVGGNPGQPCGPALQPLIDDLKRAFPTKNLDGLRPSDMTGGGSIKTVESLIGFIASSPSRSLPFALVTTNSLTALGFVKKTSKKGGKKSAKKASKKASKKSAKTSSKAGKSGGGKGRAGGKKGGKGGGK